MIKLNLLPIKEKNSLKRERIYQLFIVALLIFVWGISFISVELSIAKKILEDNLPVYTTLQSKNQELAEKIKKINFKLITIDEIQKDYLEISPILVELSKITPPDLQIKSFVINKKNNEFQIKGWTKSRDELLTFQRNLENFIFFDKIEAPLSNLLKQENIDFEFRGNLKLAK